MLGSCFNQFGVEDDGKAVLPPSTHKRWRSQPAQVSACEQHESAGVVSRWEMLPSGSLRHHFAIACYYNDLNPFVLVL